jgi:hypothetical protein
MQSRYQNIKITKYQDKGDQYYLNNIYPDIPLSENDSYVISTLGDRLDLLALDFYGDVSFWWIIASANALSGDSLYIEPGLQIRIPNDVTAILNQYKLVNTLR